MTFTCSFEKDVLSFFAFLSYLALPTICETNSKATFCSLLLYCLFFLAAFIFSTDDFNVPSVPINHSGYLSFLLSGLFYQQAFEFSCNVRFCCQRKILPQSGHFGRFRLIFTLPGDDLSFIIYLVGQYKKNACQMFADSIS